ncbi:MAG: oxidoreductase [Candidatus Jordarchaeum sp.]|uniref:oxidoreductase n=1 Tax=Candidatus Jordarchaeum sp. TaxID=2823881 RepID=UPI00404B1EEC
MLFEPIKIGSMEIKNRIFLPAMHLGYAVDNFVDDRVVNFYEARAKGGAGIILVGGCATEPLGTGLPNMMSLSDDKFIPGMRRLADAIKKHGARAAVQLLHAGPQTWTFILGTQPVSASAVKCKLTGEIPRELTIPEIEETVENFALTSKRAKDAGFDAVEVIGGVGYLVARFLSPRTNLRRDRYGGDVYGRVRFAVEIVERIKEKLGKEFPLIFKLSGDEFMKRGTTIEETRIIAQELEKAGVDCFNVAVAWHESPIPQITMNIPGGAFAFLAEKVREVVSVPVVAGNRINDPFVAEKILREGKADIISLGRALIADPEFPIKAKEGRFAEIRKCVACNQGCFDHVFQAKPIECLVNPDVSREAEYEIKPVATPKKVLIAGGGPGGMEAARVAKLRGHEVYLYEKSDRLGGQLSWAAVPKERNELGNLVDYLSYQMYLQNINVVLEKEVTPEVVEQLNPDVVILATGVNWIVPQIPGVDRPNVVMALDVLADRVPIGKKVVIIGGGGVGCETGLYLMEKGSIDAETMLFLVKWGAMNLQSAYELTKSNKEVTIVEMLDKMGQDIGGSTRWTILKSLSGSGVKMLTTTKVTEITDKGVVLDGGEVLEADTVVIAVGSTPNNELVEKLKGKVPEIYAIGDCVTPRKAIDAMHEAAAVARKI